MAETRKVLGQVALAATTLTDVYVVPASTEAVVSTIVACNRGAGATTFHIAVAPGGAVDDNSHYLYYDYPLPGNETFATTIGIALESSDTVRAWAASSDVSVSVFGVELT